MTTLTFARIITPDLSSQLYRASVFIPELNIWECGWVSPHERYRYFEGKIYLKINPVYGNVCTGWHEVTNIYFDDWNYSFESRGIYNLPSSSPDFSRLPYARRTDSEYLEYEYYCAILQSFEIRKEFAKEFCLDCDSMSFPNFILENLETSSCSISDSPEWEDDEIPF